MSTATANSRSASTLKQWAARAVHTVTLYSGAVVKVRLPDLSRLLKNDMLPEKLRGIALKQAFGDLELAAPLATENGDTSKEDTERYEAAKELAELLDTLVLEMVVEPKLTREDLDSIPAEDRDLLVSIAQRERDTDALGVRLGVEPLSRWESFRVRHRKHFGCCDESCAACEEIQREFSSTDLGGV